MWIKERILESNFSPFFTDDNQNKQIQSLNPAKVQATPRFLKNTVEKGVIQDEIPILAVGTMYETSINRYLPFKKSSKPNSSSSPVKDSRPSIDEGIRPAGRWHLQIPTTTWSFWLEKIFSDSS